MITNLEIYDPPMCCSTGVCGPDPQPELAEFSAALERLSRQGVKVRRYNLGQEPMAFATNPIVKQLLDDSNGDGLPIVLADGEVFAHGSYPSWDQLSRLLNGHPVSTSDSAPKDEAIESDSRIGSLVSPAVTELIAIGAAIAAHCEPCFRYHYDQARKLGVSKEDMIEAVNVALRVKEVPAQAMVQLARRYLVPNSDSAASGGCAGDDGCCS